MADILEKSTSTQQTEKCKIVQKLKYPPDAKRKDEVTITRAKIGHSCLSHYYIIRKESAPVCNTYIAFLTIEHIPSHQLPQIHRN